MRTRRKSRITVTLDTELVALFSRLNNDLNIKTSSYLNRVIRRHFLRPGKGMEQYALKPATNRF